MSKYLLAGLVFTAALTTLILRLAPAPVEAAPEPPPATATCPWQAWVEIVDCRSQEVTGWRVASSPREEICVGETLPHLLEQATDLYEECLGDRQCREYKWCA